MSSQTQQPLAQRPDKACITELNDNDVLCGRGASSDRFEGNVRFRAIVRERRQEYRSANKPNVKARIAQEVMDIIRLRGGRFLRKVDFNEIRQLGLPDGVQGWLPVDVSVALDKVKQALREITSDESKAQRQSPETAAALDSALRASALGAGRQSSLVQQPLPSFPGSGLAAARAQANTQNLSQNMARALGEPYSASAHRQPTWPGQHGQQQQQQQQQPQQPHDQRDTASLLLDMLANQARSRESSEQSREMLASMSHASVPRRASAPFSRDSLRHSAILQLEREQDLLQSTLNRRSALAATSQMPDASQRAVLSAGLPSALGEMGAASRDLRAAQYPSGSADASLLNPQLLPPRDATFHDALLQIQRDNNLRQYLGSRARSGSIDPLPNQGSFGAQPIQGGSPSFGSPGRPALLPATLGPIASLRSPSEMMRADDPYRALRPSVNVNQQALRDESLHQQLQMRSQPSQQVQQSQQQQQQTQSFPTFPLDDATCDRVASSWKAIPGTYRDILALERERPFTGQDLNILLLTRAWAELSRDYDCLAQIRTVLGMVLQLESSLLRLNPQEVQTLVNEFYAMPTTADGWTTLHNTQGQASGPGASLTSIRNPNQASVLAESLAQVSDMRHDPQLPSAVAAAAAAVATTLDASGRSTDSPESSRKRKATDFGESS